MQLAGNETEGDEQQQNVDPGCKQYDLEALKDRQWLVVMVVRPKDNSLLSVLCAIERADTADGHSAVGCIRQGFIMFVDRPWATMGGGVVFCHWKRERIRE